MRRIVFLFLTSLLICHLPQAQIRHVLKGSIWSGTHTPLKKGTELYFQGDTLVLLDMDGYKPADQYQFVQKNDTVYFHLIEEYSVSCRQEQPGVYRLFWANNGEKLLFKPIQDLCMERFTRLVAESPWYRKREKEEVPQDWHFLDPEKDGVAGASIYQAYTFLKFRKSQPVTVAVIDCPVDYSHEDLAANIWKNEKEIPGNRIDDDKNGFKDDVRGWFFSASKSGIPVEQEQKDATQIVSMWRSRFPEGVLESAFSGQDAKDYRLFRKASGILEREQKRMAHYRRFFSDSLALFSLLNQLVIQSEEPVNEAQIRGWKISGDTFSVSVIEVLADLYKTSRPKSFDELSRKFRNQYTSLKNRYSGGWLYEYNTQWNPREMVTDHPEIPYEKMYGSGNLKNPSAAIARHGTHVAGIIGAIRGNGKGIEGIADNVRIMVLGAVPGRGDERDKDVANCIRYAADHGAKIINMSFGKSMSAHRKTLEDAIRYAEKKGVLFVHAAGNSRMDRDTVHSFPVPDLEEGSPVESWIEVGNNTRTLDENLVSPSSCFGKKTVDLFAPGTEIFSTMPDNRYAPLSGTSMAAPLVSGIAALIWSYFPNLTAVQIKKVLTESVYRPSVSRVKKPGTDLLVPFESLSVSGGIINARQAVFLAEKLARKK